MYKNTKLSYLCIISELNPFTRRCSENFVKIYRENGKLTQEALANHLNVSRQTIISIENGKYVASLELALKLAEFFQTTVENLFSLKEDHEN